MATEHEDGGNVDPQQIHVLTHPIRPGEYLEDTDPEVLAHNGKIVDRQLERLGSGTAGHGRIDEFINELRRVQECGVEHPLPFDRYYADDGHESAEPVLVARGQLVVRTAPPAGVVDSPDTPPAGGHSPPGAHRRRILERLAQLGYEPAAGSGQPRAHDPRTEVFRAIPGRPKLPSQLARDIARLRSGGISAQFNLIVLLGHIWKGDDLPGIAKKGLAVPEPEPAAETAVRQVRVAVIDTGSEGGFQAKRDDGWLTDVPQTERDVELRDVAPVDNRTDWFAGHGSFVAGVVQQVAPGVEVKAYRCTVNSGLATEKDVAETMLLAANDAAESGVHLVINASLGTPAVDGMPPLALREAVELIGQKYPDAVIVASAGNNGTDESLFPAAFPQVVSVGALDADYRPAAFSSFGPTVTCSTVGVGVVSTFVPGRMPPTPLPDVPDYEFDKDPFAVWSGSSFAAPQIAGAVARLAHRNGTTPQRALAALLDGLPELSGFGRVVRNLLPGTRPTAIVVSHSQHP